MQHLWMQLRRRLPLNTTELVSPRRTPFAEVTACAGDLELTFAFRRLVLWNKTSLKRLSGGAMSSVSPCSRVQEPCFL